MMEEEMKNHNSSRGKGRGRGRGKKKSVDNEVKIQESTFTNYGQLIEQEKITLDLDADITQLEAPTFSTINKGPPEPMLRLNWDHKTHLIGEKVINPMIHCCDKCEAPILIYGRMIPCKHVFCLTCAEREGKVCPRCQDKVVRVEKTGLGTVFMCTFGGTRYGNTGCRRTYLSQRDLQAHINHRHVSGGMVAPKDGTNNQLLSLNMKPLSTSCRIKPSVTYHAAAAGDPRVHTNNNDYFHKMHHSPSSHTSSTSQQSRQSHHHASISHQSEQQQSSQGGGMSHQPFPALQSSSSQRHLPVSNAQQLLQSPADFVNQMMSNFMQSNSTNLNPSLNACTNLITIQTHDPNIDSGGATMGHPSRSTNFHQAYSPQFSQTSSPGIPFPVPPSGQPGINPVPQTQYFPSNPLTTYPTSTSQRSTVPPQFSPNSPAQPMMNQSQMMPSNTSTLRRPPQFPVDSAITPFPVPPPHRWPQPSQSNQTHFY